MTKKKEVKKGFRIEKFRFRWEKRSIIQFGDIKKSSSAVIVV